MYNRRIILADEKKNRYPDDCGNKVVYGNHIKAFNLSWDTKEEINKEFGVYIWKYLENWIGRDDERNENVGSVIEF